MILAPFLLACGDGSRSDTAAVDSPGAEIQTIRADSFPAARTRILGGNRVAGVLFDPARVKAGDRIGALRLDSIEVRTAHDSTRVGTARFGLPIELTGNAMRHFDADITDLCFEADSASAAKLPRWHGDERRAWFCFENQETARRAIGAPGDSVRTTIVIDRFTIHRGMSDAVNSARLVRVIAR